MHSFFFIQSTVLFFSASKKLLALIPSMSAKRKADELEQPLASQEILHSPKRSKTNDSETSEVAETNGIKDQSSVEIQPEAVQSVIVQASSLMESDGPCGMKDPALVQSEQKELKDKQNESAEPIITDVKEKTCMEESLKINEQPSERVSGIISSEPNSTQNEEPDDINDKDPPENGDGKGGNDNDAQEEQEKEQDGEIEKEEPEERDDESEKEDQEDDDDQENEEDENDDNDEETE
jgi:hypothetical protein